MFDVAIPSPARLRRAALITGFVLVTPLLSACTQEDIDWLLEIGEEWGRANGVINAAGNIAGKTGGGLRRI